MMTEVQIAVPKRIKILNGATEFVSWDTVEMGRSPSGHILMAEDRNVIARYRIMQEQNKSEQSEPKRQ